MSIDDTIMAIAKKQYKPDGPNQWTHIMRVLRRAEAIAKWRKKPLSEEERLAVLFHDSAKWIPEFKGQDHGESSAIHTYGLLKGRVREAALKAAVRAIAKHNYDKDPEDPVAELLMSADANIPNLGWYLRKSYNHAKHQLGLDHAGSVLNAYNYAKKGTATLSNKKYRPKLYEKAFAADIKKTEDEVGKLTADDVWPIIQKYQKDNPDSSIFE